MHVAHPDILPVGFRHEFYKTVTATDVHLWAGLTGQRSPGRSISAFAQQTAEECCVAPDAYLVGLVTSTATHLATRLPPPGGHVAALRVHFAAPVLVGTTLYVVATVMTWDAVAGLYWLDIRATRAGGTPVMLGVVELRPYAFMLATA